MTGETRERYGRDKNNLSRAKTPIYKGISEDDGRDGGIFMHAALAYTFLKFLTLFLGTFQIIP